MAWESLDSGGLFETHTVLWEPFFLCDWKSNIHYGPKSLGLVKLYNVKKKIILSSPSLHLFDQKYSKTSNIVGNQYKLK